VHAFVQALKELDAEGGIARRHERFCKNHKVLVEGMQEIGFRPLLPRQLQSPIITAFHSPEDSRWSFDDFYRHLKAAGFVIYPGKVTEVDTFRIGTIGDIRSDDIHRLLQAIKEAICW
jgi:2-aminoethylphosphonate-pyruvate transaminase